MRLGLSLQIDNGVGGGGSGLAMDASFLGPALPAGVVHSRPTLATVFDSAGKLTYCPNNLAPYSNNFTTWTKTLSGSGLPISVTPGYTADERGRPGQASRVILDIGVGAGAGDYAQLETYAATVGGVRYVNSIWIKSNTGDTYTLMRYTNDGTGGGIVVTPEWQEFSWIQSGAGGGGFRLRLRGNEGTAKYADISVTRFRLSAVTYEAGPRAQDDVETTGAAYYGPRYDYNPATLAARGLLIEGARTNLLLYNRDLSNAAWTKTNTTAARNQAGVDGAASSASLVTATAVNGTVLQAVTSASAARATSTYVKRVTGAGAVGMTTDGGATWTTIVIPATWGRVALPNQTVTNPSVGFRLAVSGDAIAVDCVQSEATTSVETSAIITQDVAVTRSADVVSITGAAFAGLFNPSEGAFAVEFDCPEITANLRVLGVSDGTTANNAYMYTAGGAVRANGTIASVAQTPVVGAAITVNTPVKAALSYGASGWGLSVNGAGPATQANGTPIAADRMFIGASELAGASGHINGHVSRLRYFNREKTGAELAALAA